MIQIELNKTNELLTVERKKNADYPDIYNYLNSVSYMNLDTFLEKGSTILYVGRPSCDDCNNFEPEFIKYISEHKLTNKLTYLNVNEVQKNLQTGRILKENMILNIHPHWHYSKKEY